MPKPDVQLSKEDERVYRDVVDFGRIREDVVLDMEDGSTTVLRPDSTERLLPDQEPETSWLENTIIEDDDAVVLSLLEDDVFFEPTPDVLTPEEEQLFDVSSEEQDNPFEASLLRNDTVEEYIDVHSSNEEEIVVSTSDTEDSYDIAFKDFEVSGLNEPKEDVFVSLNQMDISKDGSQPANSEEDSLGAVFGVPQMDTNALENVIVELGDESFDAEWTNGNLVPKEYDDKNEFFEEEFKMPELKKDEQGFVNFGSTSNEPDDFVTTSIENEDDGFVSFGAETSFSDDEWSDLSESWNEANAEDPNSIMQTVEAPEEVPVSDVVSETSVSDQNTFMESVTAPQMNHAVEPTVVEEVTIESTSTATVNTSQRREISSDMLDDLFEAETGPAVASASMSTVTDTLDTSATKDLEIPLVADDSTVISDMFDEEGPSLVDEMLEDDGLDELFEMGSSSLIEDAANVNPSEHVAEAAELFGDAEFEDVVRNAEATFFGEESAMLKDELTDAEPVAEAVSEIPAVEPIDDVLLMPSETESISKLDALLESAVPNNDDVVLPESKLLYEDDQFEYWKIHSSKIHPNPKNEGFSMDNIDELKASILDVGLIEDIVVAHAGDDKFVNIAGHRRKQAIDELIAEGHDEFSYITYKIPKIGGIDLPLSDERKQEYVLATTNAEARRLTPGDQLKLQEMLTSIYEELKANGMDVGSRYDFIKDKAGLSRGTVHSNDVIIEHLSDDLKRYLDMETIPKTSLLTIAKYDATYQKAFLEKIQTDNVNGALLTKQYLKELEESYVAQNAEEEVVYAEKAMDLLVQTYQQCHQLQQEIGNVDYSKYDDVTLATLEDKVSHYLQALEDLKDFLQ